MSRPIHFELPVDDPARAGEFYERVFGWEIQRWEGAPYWLVTSGPEDEPGINGALGARSEGFAVPTIVIGVADIEAAIRAAEEAGATIVTAKSAIPRVGFSAYFRDTEGNQVGLFEDDESAAAG